MEKKATCIRQDNETLVKQVVIGSYAMTTFGVLGLVAAVFSYKPPQIVRIGGKRDGDDSSEEESTKRRTLLEPSQTLKEASSPMSGEKSFLNWSDRVIS